MSDVSIQYSESVVRFATFIHNLRSRTKQQELKGQREYFFSPVWISIKDVRYTSYERAEHRSGSGNEKINTQCRF